jgi:hypothetical protein
MAFFGVPSPKIICRREGGEEILSIDDIIEALLKVVSIRGLGHETLSMNLFAPQEQIFTFSLGAVQLMPAFDCPALPISQPSGLPVYQAAICRQSEDRYICAKIPGSTEEFRVNYSTG